METELRCESKFISGFMHHLLHRSNLFQIIRLILQTQDLRETSIFVQDKVQPIARSGSPFKASGDKIYKLENAPSHAFSGDEQRNKGCNTVIDKKPSFIVDQLIFKTNPLLACVNSEIHTIQQVDASIVITQNIFGITGPTSPLPQHFNELVLERLAAKDTTLKVFLDLFTDYLLKLFYNVWQQSQFFINYEQGIALSKYDDYTLKTCLALCGHQLYLQHDISTDAIIYYAGILSYKPRTQAGLITILQDYFSLPITIQSFCGEWINITTNMQTKLNRYNQLGMNTIIGARVWHLQNHFEVVIGPLDYANFYQLLPAGNKLNNLKRFIQYYCGIEYTYTFKLALMSEEIPQWQFSKNKIFFLGWNVWFKKHSGIARCQCISLRN